MLVTSYEIAMRKTLRQQQSRIAKLDWIIPTEEYNGRKLEF